MRAAYSGRVPGGADLVCYWFERARAALVAEQAQYVGLVATQSIRKGSNRHVLDTITREGVIYDAWADEPWTLDGAAVRVSLVCCAKTAPLGPVHLDGASVAVIYADLTAGDADLTTARRLPSNAGLCFQGNVKIGAFDVLGE